MGKRLLFLLLFFAVTEASAQNNIDVYPITHGCLDLSSKKAFYLIQSEKDVRAITAFENDYCESYGLEPINYTKYSALVYSVETSGIKDPIFRPELTLNGNVAVFTVHVFGEATHTREFSMEHFTVKFSKLPVDVELQVKREFHNSGKSILPER